MHFFQSQCQRTDLNSRGRQGEENNAFQLSVGKRALAWLTTRASALFSTDNWQVAQATTRYCSVEMKGPLALGDISRRKR